MDPSGTPTPGCPCTPPTPQPSGQGREAEGGCPASRQPWALTCEDGHAVEAAVQLAEQDGEEAVCSQHADIPGALVIDNHVLWLLSLCLGP